MQKKRSEFRDLGVDVLKYKIIIKDGILKSVFAGEELNEEIAQFSILGNDKGYARLKMSNGEEVVLSREQVEIKYE